MEAARDALGEAADALSDIPEPVPVGVSRRLTVTLGMQKFSPVQYNTFDIGPYVLEVELREGESVEAAHAHAMEQLEACAKKEFTRALDAYLDRIGEARLNLKVRRARS